MNVNEFINPKSMLTPGMSGFLIMGISNSVWKYFGNYGLFPERVALVLSLLLVIFVVSKYKAGWFEKIFYITFNTLFVFSVAVGSNVGAVNLAISHLNQDQPSMSYRYYSNVDVGSKERSFINNWFQHKENKK